MVSPGPIFATELVKTFPMVVAPRYTPKEANPQFVDFEPGSSGWGDVLPPERDDTLEQPPVLRPEMGNVNPVSLKVSLDAGFPLGDVASPHHEVMIERDGKRAATIALKDELVPANTSPDPSRDRTWSRNCR